jgi:hypothetical protein
MPEDTADIVGTTGANFTLTIDATTITSAFLLVTGQADTPLTIAPNGREVTVPSLPAGDSIVRLDLFWVPGDPDATIDVGTVTSGEAEAAESKGRIDAGETPGFPALFGR